jgi:hypothetical protein
VDAVIYYRPAFLVTVFDFHPSASLATPAAFPIFVTLLVTALALACASLARRESPLWATRLVFAGYIILIV